ncbi:RNA polymerase sigma factor [Gracilibacillus sp. S3-1-1]|uniref:RNA polymerase sigma factor n=1 Tax=Gracilibacillus pellucidus TaxID=3095368 RepID=A0ACC6M272_9BACI|nr:RNA polymerase sigma factor [Gracilibacillus sp. S3-1-1]MDX8044832.1 RNA polymerase sigma factor [Gracilibacillus sp. S3-1-1]
MFTNDIFSSLVTKYQSMMHCTALKLVKDRQIAEDIVQESWIKVMKQHIDIESIEKMGAWLRTITSRTAIDFLRKENRHHMGLLEKPELMEEHALCSCSEVDDQINWQSTLDELEECVNQSEKLHVVFQLKFKMGFDDEQIAKTLEITPSAVKTRIFRTRQLLKKNYQRKESTLKPGA